MMGLLKGFFLSGLSRAFWIRTAAPASHLIDDVPLASTDGCCGGWSMVHFLLA